ncbi:MAG: pilus assembly protein [Rhodospirillales bacterium]|nr:pilus assembly protein [Rhodospirillales bacterium]
MAMMRRVAGYVLRKQLRVRRQWRRWQADQSGFTAVEFAIVAMPFLMLLFGTISVCLFYFTNFTLENAVWQASRGIRTGQFQQGEGSYSGITSDEDRKKAFKQALCAKAPPYIDCNKVVVLAQSNSGGFGSITQPVCATDGTMVDQSKAEFNPGGASSVVLITACYPWGFGGNLPFFALNNMKDGSLLMQASVAFRTEPYPTD